MMCVKTIIVRHGYISVNIAINAGSVSVYWPAFLSKTKKLSISIERNSIRVLRSHINGGTLS